jgi:dipeptidyl aminopeptidase/acylaminoacyl peptidase
MKHIRLFALIFLTTFIWAQEAPRPAPQAAPPSKKTAKTQAPAAKSPKPEVKVLAEAGAAKRPLTHKDYDSWRSINRQVLSPDGKFLAYAVFPEEGSDGEVVIRELATGREVRQSAGEEPPPPAPDPEAETPPRPPSLSMSFTSDSRYLVFSTFPGHDETAKAKKEKKPADQMPKGGLGIVELASGTPTRIADVKNYQVPSKGGPWGAYLKQPKPAEKPSGNSTEKTAPANAAPPIEKESDDEAFVADDESDQARGGPRPGGTAASRTGSKKEYGTDLVLRNLTSGAELTFSNVSEFTFTKDAGALVYAVSSRKEEENGVFAVVPGIEATPLALLKGKGKYSRLTWDVKQSELAFTSDRDDAAAKPPKVKVYYWGRKAPEAAELVSAATPGFKSDFVVSPNGALSFSRNGRLLFLGCAPPLPPEKDADATADTAEEKVSMDLWNWRDDYVQPMQKVRSTQDKNRNYRAVYFLDTKKFVQLADKDMSEITLPDEGRYAIGMDDRPYRRMAEYDQAYSDYYIVDLESGERKPAGKQYAGGGGRGGSGLSPDGRYLLFYRERDWQTISIPDGAVTNLTANRGLRFWNEEDDHPGEPRGYGNAGWTRDGKSVLLYDRYDVWQISADGKSAQNLTAGAGRAQKIMFRVTRLEPEEDDEPRGIDPKKPLLLTGVNQETFDTGYWRVPAFDSMNQPAAPQKLIGGPKVYRALAKAKDADVVVMTASSFSEFPDLLITDSNFQALRKVTDLNAQKARLLWGTSELVRFTGVDGMLLKAALYKPENFDPSKKYPMMVYIYEKLSQSVNNFVRPGPGSSINISYYVSNGYLVLTPDIVYEVGHPGQSALKCVLPAIQAVVDRGYVNEKAIGIQGHSWGGYQIAYMLTQTRRFAAAEAGAPVVNMFSAYNGIRWGPGIPRQFQYEKDQSRIGANIWQSPALFFENSAVFSLNRVQTPLLILHNDADDAVPWYQGIELFLSMRRLGKEAYLAVYNGEPHGLRKRVNMKDYTVRMQQFFDHKLKGAPMPDWMEHGIPYNEREQEKEKLKALMEK